MRVPVSWLREYVDLTLSVEELARRLVFTSCEVDRVVRRGAPGGDHLEFFVAAAYGGEMLNRWSAVRLAEPAEYSRFELPNGPLFIGFVLLLAISTLMSFINVWIAWRVTDW